MKNKIYKLISISFILIIGLFASCRSHVDSPVRKSNKLDSNKCYLQAKCLADRAMKAPDLNEIDFAKVELFEDESILTSYISDNDGAALDKLVEDVIEVTIGKHTYSLKLYNKSGNLLKVDSQDIEIKPGVNEIEFNMQIFSGQGKLRIFYDNIDDSVQTVEITIYQIKNNTLQEVKTVKVDKINDQFAFKEDFDNGYYYVGICDVTNDITDGKILYQDNVIVETNRRTVFGQENIYTKNSVKIMDSDGKLHVWNFKSNNEIDYYVDSKLIGTTFYDDEIGEYDQQIPIPVIPFTKTEKGYELAITDENGDSVVYSVNQNDSSIQLKSGVPVSGINTPAVIDYFEFKKYDDEQNIINKLVSVHECDYPMLKISPQTLNGGTTKKFAKVESDNELAALIYLDNDGKMVISPYSTRDEEAKSRTDKDLITTVTITYDDNTTDYFTLKVNEDGTVSNTYIFREKEIYLNPQDLGYTSYSSFEIDQENSKVENLVSYELVTTGENAGKIKITSNKSGVNVYDVKGESQSNPNVSKKIQIYVDYEGNIVYSVLANTSINLTIPTITYEDYSISYSVHYEYPDELLEVTKFIIKGSMYDSEKNYIFKYDDEGNLLIGNDTNGNPLKLDMSFDWFVDGHLFTTTKKPELEIYSNQIGSGTHDIMIVTEYDGKTYSNNKYLDVEPYISTGTDYKVTITYYDVVEYDYEDACYYFKSDVQDIVDEWYENVSDSYGYIDETKFLDYQLDFSQVPNVKKVTETWYGLQSEEMELYSALSYEPGMDAAYRFDQYALFVVFDENGIAYPKIFNDDLLWSITDVTVDGYVVIGEDSFYLMPNLKTLSFGEGTGIIEDYVGNMTTMEKLNLPSTITSISEYSLYCNKIDSFDISETNYVYATKDGVLYTKDFSKIVLYPPQKDCEEFTIPSTVKYLGSSSFNFAKNLKKVNFKKPLKGCSEYAFYNSGIEEIDTKYLGSVLPEGLFCYSNLKNVIIDSNIEFIGGYVFDHCPIETITFKSEIPPEFEYIMSLFSEVEYAWDDINEDYLYDSEGKKIIIEQGFDIENFGIYVPKNSFTDYAEIFDSLVTFLRWTPRAAVSEWTLADSVSDTIGDLSFEINHYYLPEGVKPVKVTINFNGEQIIMELIEDENDERYYTEYNLTMMIREMNAIWAEDLLFCDFMDVANLECLAYLYSTFHQIIDNDFYYLSLDPTGTEMEDSKMEVKVEFSDGKTFEYVSVFID